MLDEKSLIDPQRDSDMYLLNQNIKDTYVNIFNVFLYPATLEQDTTISKLLRLEINTELTSSKTDHTTVGRGTNRCVIKANHTASHVET